MSEINPDLTWYLSRFLKRERLPTDIATTKRNCEQLDSHELAYWNEPCQIVGKAVKPPCCRALHINLFLGSTGNNLNNNLHISSPKYLANIARLFRTTIGQGYISSVRGHTEELANLTRASNNKYYKYYIPGADTPFPEVNDLDYSMPGLASAAYDEE